MRVYRNILYVYINLKGIGVVIFVLTAHLNGEDYGKEKYDFLLSKLWK